jgi:hypothetical protein
MPSEQRGESVRHKRGQETFDKFVIETRECVHAPWVSLPGTPSVQLPVNPGCICPFGGDHMQTSQICDSRAKPDVSAASSEVCCDRYHSPMPSFSDNLSFVFELRCIEEPE